MSKAEIISALAEKTGLARTQVESVLDALAELSYREARNGFVVPGIGKLVLVERGARQGRNPKTGEPIAIPARKAVKIRVLKACKDAILSQ